MGRDSRTKETLPDFLKWPRVTRHPLVFRGLTGSQQTPGFWGVTKAMLTKILRSSPGSRNAQSVILIKGIVLPTAATDEEETFLPKPMGGWKFRDNQRSIGMPRKVKKALRGLLQAKKI